MMETANQSMYPLTSSQMGHTVGMTKREVFVKDIISALTTRNVNMTLPLTQQERNEICETAIALTDEILEILP